MADWLGPDWLPLPTRPDPLDGHIRSIRMATANDLIYLHCILYYISSVSIVSRIPLSSLATLPSNHLESFPSLHPPSHVRPSQGHSSPYIYGTLQRSIPYYCASTIVLLLYYTNTVYQLTQLSLTNPSIPSYTHAHSHSNPPETSSPSLLCLTHAR